MENLKRFILLGSITVVALGIFREVFVLSNGLETPLQELRQFDLDAENNVPSWWSSSLMLASAMVMFLFAKADDNRGLFHSKVWLPLATVFLLLSIDESASFHEALMNPLRTVLDAGGIFYYAWVVPAFLCLAVFGLLILRSFLRLPGNIQFAFALAGLIYVSGALGMELFGGWLDYSGLRMETIYSLSIIVEETLEITGLTLFLLALIRLAEQHVTLRINGQVPHSASRREKVTADAKPVAS
ncbi:MAG: hypothetical protein JJ908_12400 [Rhizobiales bacterium]|nr:hypothetical protein [Hyphomicrobiales bacterium]MBO6699626.1 hypothetical protein [Hyphomicrobiales bacterium]MBO6737164.1 hypothetical protein [Hyphomicrobiales bacterium]MBO6911762.1 hypothetical protein [Hyphomicrobiales bacterium]MBO6954699.1 hypothetical protein [Hyphomicrobiales bacterium]